MFFGKIGLNITVDIDGDINGDRNMHSCKRHWMRHTAMVPKGFIRYHVLEALSEKPVSGSEIINEIEKRTDGRWRPSPGSIYPLLAWLQDNGYVKELPSNGTGMKRYELTEAGKSLLEEQKKIRIKSRSEAKLFIPPFLGALGLHIPPEKTAEIRQSMRRFMRAFFRLGIDLEEEFSEQIVEEVRKVLDETTEELEKLDKKLKGEGK